MTLETAAPFIFFALGVFGRVVIPYVQARVASDGPISFDWRFLVGQLIAALVALIPLVSGSEFVTNLGAMGWAAALVYGWGSGDVGRTAQKAVAK